MEIKNTKELRLRARSHAKYDHIKQGTYGSGHTNGKTEYKGCAVGCLSVPHRQADLKAFIREHGALNQEEDAYVVNFHGFEQREWIEAEFGICEALMIVGEGFFEAQPTHGGAIEFVKNFALAFNEGADFTPTMAHEWCEEHMEGRWATDWEDVKDWITYVVYQSGDENVTFESVCAALTEEFLGWIHSVKRVPVSA